jgi:hypothetical protein
MRNATLVWKASDYPRQNILVLDFTNATRLMYSIFRENSGSKRLVITRNKYFYNPSDEYKKYVVRFKGVMK